jgi:hypothetical protein
MTKPRTAAGYRREHVDAVYATCLYVATVLGNLMDDRLVIVGGFVPFLIVPQDHLPAGADPHIGTEDLDLGLSLALLEAEQYHEVAARLRAAGFEPDSNQRGHLTRQRWTIAVPGGGRARVDFLIPAGRGTDTGGQVFDLEPDFAAFVTPGLELAWRDRVRVTLTGRTVREERATRDVWVCGPGAFVVLKALAFVDRGEPKDAYDLFYVLRNFGAGPEEVAAACRPLLDHPLAARALEILAADFTDVDSVGPRRLTEFLPSAEPDALRADVVAFIRLFLASCGR